MATNRSHLLFKCILTNTNLFKLEINLFMYEILYFPLKEAKWRLCCIRKINVDGDVPTVVDNFDQALAVAHFHVNVTLENYKGGRSFLAKESVIKFRHFAQSMFQFLVCFLLFCLVSQFCSEFMKHINLNQGIRHSIRHVWKMSVYVGNVPMFLKPFRLMCC